MKRKERQARIETEREMERRGQKLIGFFVLLILQQLHWGAESQSLIPAKFDGFVYGKSRSQFNPDAVLIEAFFDPVCPDSRDAWPPLKQALAFYGHRVSLTVHPFPLPYHDNAFVTSRALHVVNRINSSLTYPLLEAFFQNQVKFYNQQTSTMTRVALMDYLISFISESVGYESSSAIKMGFSDSDSNIQTRISFKYGCSRGVIGTPVFFVNGFALPDPGDSIEYGDWRKILDPLVGIKHKEEAQFHYSV